MRRCTLALAFATTAACGGDSESCHIDDVVARFVGSVPVIDCGDIAIDAANMPSANYSAARLCVLDAIAARAAFRVDWTGADGFELRSFVGMAVDDAFEISFFRMDLRSRSEDGAIVELPTSRTTCVELRDMGDPCGVAPAFSLCLECDGPVERETCRPGG